MKKLTEYAKELKAVAIEKVVGPNGAFISLTMADNTKQTLPIGKRSQNGSIPEYAILISEDNGQAICTVNEYKVAEKFTLETVEAIN